MKYRIIDPYNIKNPFYLFYRTDDHMVRYNLKVTDSLYEYQGYIDVYRNRVANSGMIFNKHVDYYAL